MIGVGSDRRGDEEHEIARVIVAEVHRIRQACERECGLRHGSRAAVGYRDPAGHAGRGLRLTGVGVCRQRVGISGATRAGDDGAEGIDDVPGCRAQRDIESDELRGDD